MPGLVVLLLVVVILDDVNHKEGEYLSLVDSSNISAIREGSVAMNSNEIKAKGNITHEV